jgi:hypothetical protein
MYDLADLNTKRGALEAQLKARDKRLQRFLSRGNGGESGTSAARARDQALCELKCEEVAVLLARNEFESR